MTAPACPDPIVIDTVNRFLYLVEDGGAARRYGVGSRPAGASHGRESIGITRKAEWPDWRPPVEMRRRQPGLPVMMPGGPKNPLGARAMYLGSTLYRIHGTAEPWTIGHAVSFRLHPHAQRRRHRPLRAGEGRNARDRVVVASPQAFFARGQVTRTLLDGGGPRQARLPPSNFREIS